MTNLVPPPFHVVVAREVRWFVPGQVPQGALDWFAEGAADKTLEHRTDRYDAGFAVDGWV